MKYCNISALEIAVKLGRLDKSTILFSSLPVGAWGKYRTEQHLIPYITLGPASRDFVESLLPHL